MSEKSKRPWLQFHLSTALVMIILLGMFLWMNVANLENNPRSIYEVTAKDFQVTYGWPLIAYNDLVWSDFRWSSIRVLGVAVDFLFAVTCVIFGGVAVESIIRRREARKT